MRHHFDSPSSLEDPRIDPTDFFVFAPSSSHATIYILNVSVAEGLKPSTRPRSTFPHVGEPYDASTKQALADATH
jgi:hypothetical protein